MQDFGWVRVLEVEERRFKEGEKFEIEEAKFGEEVSDIRNFFFLLFQV